MFASENVSVHSFMRGMGKTSLMDLAKSGRRGKIATQRFCIDYRKLYPISIKEWHSFPD